MIVSGLFRFLRISEEEMFENVRDLLDSSDPAVAPLVGPGKVKVTSNAFVAYEQPFHDPEGLTRSHYLQIGLHKPRCQDVRTSNIGPHHELLPLPRTVLERP
jgi:hypothetical protein